MRGLATIMRRRTASVRVSANKGRRRLVVLGLLALIIAVGTSAIFVGASSAVPLTFVDDGGADDEPGQKDLNSLEVDYGVPGATSVHVKWGWDDTATTGANTLDGCALFDTDANGFANYSFCVIVAASGTSAKLLYSCGDGAADRCTNPRAPIESPLSTAAATIVPNSDPFGSQVRRTSIRPISPITRATQTRGATPTTSLPTRRLC